MLWKPEFAGEVCTLFECSKLVPWPDLHVITTKFSSETLDGPAPIATRYTVWLGLEFLRFTVHLLAKRLDSESCYSVTATTRRRSTICNWFLHILTGYGSVTKPAFKQSVEQGRSKDFLRRAKISKSIQVTLNSCCIFLIIRYFWRDGQQLVGTTSLWTLLVLPLIRNYFFVSCLSKNFNCGDCHFCSFQCYMYNFASTIFQ